MALVFIDTETTGLDPFRHHIWEMGYATETGPIRTGFVPHTLHGADPEALAINAYHDRFTPTLTHEQLAEFDNEMKNALDGATLVAANPAFDVMFLQTRWGYAPWKYRLLDVEAYAMGALGFTTPQGLKGIADTLRERGAAIPEPDHSVAADIATLRACFLTLRHMYNK